MSALVERIIAARDQLKRREIDVFLPDALVVLADAANAITERDETIHAQRHRLERLKTFSTVELQNCAHYVNEARDAIQGCERGRELARMVLRLAQTEG